MNNNSNLGRQGSQNIPLDPRVRPQDASIYTQRPQQRTVNRNDGLQPDGAYKSMQYSPQVNYEQLNQKKKVLEELIGQFRDNNGRVQLEPYKSQQYSKRLMLLQNQIQGLMRQSYLFQGRNPGQRVIDYNILINQKQNQINQLQRKINHLESTLRMKDQRQQQLEQELQKRFSELKNKNNQIQRLSGQQRNFTEVSRGPNEVVNSNIRKLMSTLDALLKQGNTTPIQLENQIQTWIIGLPNQSVLKNKLRSADQNWLEDRYKKYVSLVATQADSLLSNVKNRYTTQIMNLKSSGIPVDFDPRIMDILGKNTVMSQIMPSQQALSKTQVVGQLINRPLFLSYSPDSQAYFNNVSRVSVQVPVQDSRTKALIHRLASQMRRLYTKYPKLASEISPELSQYLTQEIIDVIEVDELDRLVQIVKYQPQVVRVQNVYAFNTQKNRRVQFHLRVLIKALLQQMEKMKLKTGVQPQIDEGVIGMIRQQIMDVVDVDDILRVYRTVPKIVQVEKVIHQVVQKIVPVPHFVTVQRNNMQVVPVNNIQVVKDTVNVPLQVPKVHTLTKQKLVLGNQYQERIIPKTVLEQNAFNTVTQVPVVRQVQKIIQVPKDVVHVVQVPGEQKIVPLQRPIIKQIFKEKVVAVETMKQRVVQVQKIIEKIVPIYHEVPKIIEVQKIVQKIVEVPQYIQSQRVENFIQQKPVQVIVYVEKIVPIEKVIQKIKVVKQVVQKPVMVVQRQQVVKQIQVIKQIPIYMKQLQVRQVIVQKPLPPLKQEVVREVQKIVQFPLIHEKVKVQTEFRKQPVIIKQQKLMRQAVNIEVPVFLVEQKVTQVQKPVVHFVKQQMPVQIIVQKVVPLQTVRDNLIPTPFIVQKLIQKIVQVPRVVQIEKIVQKIVVVPRVIQKIVEVQKIIEKIVQKNIYHTNLQSVEYLRQVPVQVEKVVTIELPQYIYQTVQVPHVVEKQIPVVSQLRSQQVIVQQIQQPPRVAIQRIQVPVQIIQEKVAPMIVQDHVFVQLKEQVVVPIKVPQTQTLIQEKIVPIFNTVPVLQTVDRVVQKVVEVGVQTEGKVIATDRIVEKLFVQPQYRVVNNQIPHYIQRVRQVPTVVQKFIPVERVVKQIEEVPYLVQKIAKQILQIPKIYQVQKTVEIPVVHQQLITIQKIVPKIVTLNKAFAQIVDRLHEFPRLAEEMRQVQKRIDNLVVQNRSDTNIIQRQVLAQKAIILQKFKQVDRYINRVNQTLQVHDRVVQNPSQPIIITEQKILQVPVIVQKIAQRIVVMPQVVEVLKYIHQITDNDSLGVAVSQEVGVEQAEYRRLAANVNHQLSALLNIIQALKLQPQYRNQAITIQNFLVAFNKFIAYPRIRQVFNERVLQNTIEKPKFIKVPVQSTEDQRRDLASTILIDKLLTTIKRIRQANPNMQIPLEPEIAQVFSVSLDPSSKNYNNNYNQLLDQYSRAIFSRFNGYGSLNSDHHRMLKQFIEERFQLANRLKKSTKDYTKYKQLYSNAYENLQRQRNYNQNIYNKFRSLSQTINTILIKVVDVSQRNILQQKITQLDSIIFGYLSPSTTPTYQLTEFPRRPDQFATQNREKDEMIKQLRVINDQLKRDLEMLSKRQVPTMKVYSDCPVHTTTIDSQSKQIQQMRRRIQQLQASSNMNRIQDHSKCQAQISRLNSQLRKYTQQVNRLRQIELIHQNCHSKIIVYEQKITTLQREIRILRDKANSDDTNPNSRERYGTNYNQYVQAGDVQSQPISSSNSSNSSSLSDNYGGRRTSRAKNNVNVNRDQGRASIGYIQQGSQGNLTDSRKSGPNSQYNFNKNMVNSGYTPGNNYNGPSSNQNPSQPAAVSFNKPASSNVRLSSPAPNNQPPRLSSPNSTNLNNNANPAMNPSNANNAYYGTPGGPNIPNATNTSNLNRNSMNNPASSSNLSSTPNNTNIVSPSNNGVSESRASNTVIPITPVATYNPAESTSINPLVAPIQVGTISRGLSSNSNASNQPNIYTSSPPNQATTNAYGYSSVSNSISNNGSNASTPINPISIARPVSPINILPTGLQNSQASRTSRNQLVGVSNNQMTNSTTNQVTITRTSVTQTVNKVVTNDPNININNMQNAIQNNANNLTNSIASNTSSIRNQANSSRFSPAPIISNVGQTQPQSPQLNIANNSSKTATFNSVVNSNSMSNSQQNGPQSPRMVTSSNIAGTNLGSSKTVQQGSQQSVQVQKSSSQSLQASQTQGLQGQQRPN